MHCNADPPMDIADSRDAIASKNTFYRYISQFNTVNMAFTLLVLENECFHEISNYFTQNHNKYSSYAHDSEYLNTRNIVKLTRS